jgi:restriction endonuclease S subunit
MGELPREWRRDKIARLCDFVGSGGTPPTGNPDFYDGDIPWVQTGDLDDEWLDETAKTITEEGLRHSAARLYPRNTLLVAMYGATIGKLGILKFSAAVNQACCALVVRKAMDMRFMFYTLRSLRPDLIAEALGGGQQNIGQETIKQIYVIFPPLPEQQRIAAYLDASCAAIDVAVAAKHRQIETLDEIRKSAAHQVLSEGLRQDCRSKTRVSNPLASFLRIGT